MPLGRCETCEDTFRTAEDYRDHLPCPTPGPRPRLEFEAAPGAPTLVQLRAAVDADTADKMWEGERCHSPRCRGRRNPVGFEVEGEVWDRVVPPPLRHRTLCLACFDEYAQLAGVAYQVSACHVVSHGGSARTHLPAEALKYTLPVLLRDALRDVVEVAALFLAEGPTIITEDHESKVQAAFSLLRSEPLHRIPTTYRLGESLREVPR